jgi:hypothetical protein
MWFAKFVASFSKFLESVSFSQRYIINTLYAGTIGGYALRINQYQNNGKCKDQNNTEFRLVTHAADFSVVESLPLPLKEIESLHTGEKFPSPSYE